MTDSITRLNAALEGRYRVEREPGEGGMATVYLAEDWRPRYHLAIPSPISWGFTAPDLSGQ